jgi:hypothetical protein
MKSTIAAVLMAMTLAGCVAVPYDASPGYGYYGPGPYYYGPPATFHFGYHYYGGRRHHRHRH